MAYSKARIPTEVYHLTKWENLESILTDKRIQRYPKFVPEAYALLKLTPSKWEDKWYQWNQEVPANASPEVKDQAREFSELKVGCRGDLRFSKAEILALQ